VAFLTWGCAGFAGPGVFSFAVSIAVLGLIVLAAWILLCRDCPAIIAVRNTLMLLAAVMIVLTLVFFVIGSVGCAFGALAVALLFVIATLILFLLGRLVGCP
jgi:hypothetical protein